MKKLLLSIFLFLFAMPVVAQSSANIPPELKQQYPEGITSTFEGYTVDYVLAAKKNGKWGLVDYNGNCILPFEYDEIYQCYDFFSKEYSRIHEITAKKNGKWGVVDLNNQVLMPFEQKKLHIKHGQRQALASKADKKYGESSYQAKIKQMEDTRNSYIEKQKAQARAEAENREAQAKAEVENRKVTPVCSDGKWGFVSKAKPTPTYEYDSCEKLSGNIFLVSKNGKYGMVHIDGAKIILPVKYVIGRFPNYYLLYKDDKIGVLSLTGVVVLSCVYDNIFPAQNVSPLLFYLVKGEKWGLGNLQGELCSCTYDFIDNFNTNKEAVYYYKGYQGRINAQGKETLSAVKVAFDRVYNLSDNQPGVKIQLYREVIELDKELKANYTGVCLNNMGVLYENAGDRKSALSCYSQASALGNQQGAQNYKTLRRQIRAEKWQAVSNALESLSSSLAATANQYNSYNTNYGNSSSNNSASYSSSKSAYGSNSGHSMSEVQSKNTDSRTYSNDESLLIKMNTYWETQYNDNERRNIQRRMQQIRTKWVNRGFQFYHSPWEDWDGRKK